MSHSPLHPRPVVPPLAYRVYLFSEWQYRTSGIRMYTSQLAYKTVAFALILDRNCAALRVVAGFIKRIFQNHRRRCRFRDRNPRTIDPFLSSTSFPPIPPPPPSLVTVNLFTPSGADTVVDGREYTWPRIENASATLKANDVKFLRLVCGHRGSNAGTDAAPTSLASCSLHAREIQLHVSCVA